MDEQDPIVFIVDDDPAVRASLALLVEAAGWRAVAFATGAAFLAAPTPDGPSCLVLDLRLPDFSGLDVQRRVATGSCMPIIFISGEADVPTTVDAMKCGAVEFLTKPLRGDEVVEAIGQGIARSRGLLQRARDMERVRDRYATLSRREQEVMALVVAGRLNKQVGGELQISEITVKAHRGKLMRKMMARTLPDLVRMAGKLGIDG